MPTVEERLAALAISLPEPVPGRPSVVPVARHGDLAFVLSRGPAVDDDGRRYTGKVGLDLTPDEAYRAARLAGRTALEAAEPLNDYPGAFDLVVAVDGDRP